MIKQVLIIVWRWTDLDGKDLLREDFPVQGQGKIVIRINEKKSDVAIERLLEIVNKEHAAADIIILLHRKHLYSQSDIFHLMPKIENRTKRMVRSDLFGEGMEYVYYNDTYQSGLLDNDGNFMDKPMYFVEKKTEDGTKVLGKPARVLVVEDGKKMVKEAFYDKVWSYYSFPLTRTLYELQQNLFIFLVPKLMVASDDKQTKFLREWLPRDIQNQMDAILNDKISESLINRLYPDASDVQKHFEDLRYFLQTSSFSVDGKDRFLQEARWRFKRVLTAIPQPVY